MTITRLILKLFRFELLVFSIVFGLLTVAIVALVLSLRSLGLDVCRPAEALAACAPDVAAADRLLSWMPALQYVLVGGSILAGLLMGVPVVAREIEQGSATLAWTIGGSRRKWLIPRIFVVGIVVLVLVGVPSLAADLLETSRHVPPVPGDSLLDHQYRGLVVAGRAIAAFGIGTVVGAALGRSLPAVLIGVLLAIPALGGAELAFDAWRKSEAVPIDTTGSLYVSQTYRDRDGRLLQPGEAERILSPEDPAFGRRFTFVALGVPASRGGEIVTREFAAYLAAALIAVAGTIMIVDRRRPY